MQRINGFFQHLKVGTKLSVGIISIVFLLMAVTLTVVINSYRNNLISSSKKLMARELELITENLDAEMGYMSAMGSEERRVGKECSSPCRSRWSPYH